MTLRLDRGRSLARRTLLAGSAASWVPLPALAEAATKEKVAAALPNLRELARRIVDKKLVPGLAITIVHRDETVLLDGFGVREIGKPAAVDADTVFQLASVSKPLAATVVAGLVSDDGVSWDSRIRDIDPGFALQDELAAANVTIRDLFAHRSGLPGHVGDDIEELGFTQGEILHRLRLAKPAYGFRNGYSYSNFGLTEAAVAAARFSGKSWEEACEERLYKPLGMASTSSRYRDFMNRSNRAALHVRADGEWASFTRRNADAQSPAGGASSSVRDMAHWVRLLLAGGRHQARQMIDREALLQTHVPASVRSVDPSTGAASFYALGWNVDYREHGVEWAHAGAFSAGARTLVHLLPAEQLGIVVLSNAFPTGAPEGIAKTFFDLVFTGSPTRDWVAYADEIFETGYKEMMKPSLVYEAPPASPAAALPMSAYLGDYRNDYVGEAKVTDSGGALYLHLGPAGRRFPLAHFNRDVFVYSPMQEAPKARMGVSFLIGPDGKASEVTIEDLNEYGLGRLTRVGPG
ncbi:MAG: serine hydrolase [Rhodospirillales bacterium]|nr:serine hydrolase [Rhodospirillales bacterium]